MRRARTASVTPRTSGGLGEKLRRSRYTSADIPPRNSYKFGVKLRARILTTVSDSTSQKFILVGQIDKREQQGNDRIGVVFLDFANTRSRQCGDGDFEDWYARTAKGKECLMGHKVRLLSSIRSQCALTILGHPQQWYRRRKPDANCYVGNKFEDPRENEQNCPCEDDDYEWYGLVIEPRRCGSLSRFSATTTSFETATSVFQLVPNRFHQTSVQETIQMRCIMDLLVSD
jgi:hypothetical protein